MAHKTSSIFKHIYNNLHRHKFNHIQINSGGAGSGKSECALTQCWMTDRDFGVEKVSQDPAKIFECFDNITRSGECVVFEEPQLSINARTWQQVTNSAVNEVLTTFRYQHIALIFTAIDFSYIDAQARKAMQAFTEVKRSGTNPPVQYYYNISHDRKRGKEPFFIHPRVLKNGETFTIDKIVYKRRAPEHLRKEYEKQMKTEKENVRKRTLHTLKKLGFGGTTGLDEATEQELKKRLEGSKVTPTVRFILKRLDEFEFNGKLDSGLIREKLELPYNKALTTKKLVEDITGSRLIADIKKQVEERGLLKEDAK